VTEIAIYAEGGGDSAEQRAELRQGIDGLLRVVKSRAREMRSGWKVVCCGRRQATFEAFNHALRVNPAVINVLLVDAEASIPSASHVVEQDALTRVAHLGQHDGWRIPESYVTHVHLMVQCMEAWIVADAKALEEFYGQGFLRSALPQRINLEEEPKADLSDKLARATHTTQKGEYHKIKHAGRLLQKIDPEEVAKRCPRFALFTRWLEAVIEAA
jgi:hypothetical protein